MSLAQMVNTRIGGGVDQHARICWRRTLVNLEPEMNPPIPPPTRSEAFFAQIQLLQQMYNTMANMQA
jgi:hypothetical protein